MTGVLASTCVLIGAILIFRRIAEGRISPVIIYAVWLLVAVRIVVPFDFSSLLPQTAAADRERIWYLAENEDIRNHQIVSENEINENFGNLEPDKADIQKQPPGKSGGEGQFADIGFSDNSENEVISEKTQKNGTVFSWKQAAVLVWAVGAVGIAAAFVIKNIVFYRKLKKCRVYFGKTKRNIKIYRAEHVGAPFVFGFIKPGIYIDSISLKDDIILKHVLEHELGHVLHKDNFWQIVRWLCLAIQWFNPFVWAAAVLSLQDAEIACDYHVIYKKEASERFSYGKSLIKLASTDGEKNYSYLYSPLRSYHHRAFRERISKIGEFTIIERSRNFGAAVIAATIFAAAVMGCGKGAAPVNEIDYSAPAELTNDKEAAIVRKDSLSLQAEGMLPKDIYGNLIVAADNGFYMMGQTDSEGSASYRNYIDVSEKGVRPLDKDACDNKVFDGAWEGHVYFIGGRIYFYVTEADGRDALYTKKADGTEISRVCYFDDGMSPYKPWVFAAYDSKNQDIYYFSEKLKKGNVAWNKDERALVRLNLETGAQKIAGWVSAEIDMDTYGAAGDNILYEKDGNITAYNISGAGEIAIELPNREEYGHWIVENNRIYYMAKDKNTVLSMDLTTGKEAVAGKVFDEPSDTLHASMTGFMWDNYLVFYVIDDINLKSSYIAMEAGNGEKTSCRLVQYHSMSTDIIGETDEQFLIIQPNDETLTENKGQPVYMLIDKEDYWNGDYDKAVQLKHL